jgi:glutaredoxin
VEEDVKSQDADSEGEIESEGVMPKVKVSSDMPSKEDVDSHMVTHIPYRSWCDHCVRGRAVNDHHPKKKSEESSVPVISIDYAYFGETSEERKERKEKEKNGEDVKRGDMPFVVVKDRKSKKMWAYIVREKGVNPYAVKKLAKILSGTGYRRVIIKSDQEPAVMSLKEAVKRELDLEVEVAFEESLMVRSKMLSIESEVKSGSLKMPLRRGLGER